MIIASDHTGLLYSLYAFIQLLQLHSEAIVKENVTTVYVPPVVLIDRPDVMNRAILWSYSHNARICQNLMKQNIELFSKLRINILLLSLDLSLDMDEPPLGPPSGSLGHHNGHGITGNGFNGSPSRRHSSLTAASSNGGTESIFEVRYFHHCRYSLFTFY